jgi:hypothetical protein
VPLRWGSWAGRSWGGLWLIIGGGAAIAGSSAANTFTLLLAGMGVTAHAIGWSVLPTRGWRRVVVVLPSTFAMVALLPGPTYLTLLVIPLVCWMLVRHRPLRSFPMAAFPVATGVVLARVFPEYSGMLVAALVALSVVVGSAWAARWVHAAGTRPRRTPRRIRAISS